MVSDAWMIAVATKLIRIIGMTMKLGWYLRCWRKLERHGIFLVIREYAKSMEF